MSEKTERTKYTHYPKDNVVTTLDSIMDTRIGMLYSISEEIMEYALESGTYHNRIRDNFGPISQDVFRSFYRYRTKELLEYSIPSVVIRDLIFPLIRSILDLPQKGGDVQPILYINIYPYDLTESEQERIRIIIANILKISTEFVITFKLNYKDFNAKWINEHAHTIIMYDGMEWLEYQTSVNDITKDPLVGAKLIVPLLLTGSMQMGDISEEKIKALVDFYRIIIDLEFIDAGFFCFQERPDKPPEEKTTEG